MWCLSGAILYTNTSARIPPRPAYTSPSQEQLLLLVKSKVKFMIVHLGSFGYIDLIASLDSQDDNTGFCMPRLIPRHYFTQSGRTSGRMALRARTCQSRKWETALETRNAAWPLGKDKTWNAVEEAAFAWT